MSSTKGKAHPTRPGNGGAQYLYPKKHIPSGNRGLEDIAAEAQKAGMSYGKYVVQKEQNR